MRDENPPVRLPGDEEDANEIAEEAREDDVTDEQRENLAVAQARLIGDL
jgi:hypothetical protein